MIEVYYDGMAKRIGIFLEISKDTDIPAHLFGLSYIKIRKLSRDDQALLDVSSSFSSHQRHFYHFVIAVAERIISEECSAIQAINLELGCFSEILESAPILGVERQIGLMGELLFLELLVSRHGIAAYDSWIGPLGEPHDFRIENREFEVKTTVSTKRIHTIHGMEQLVPSVGCSLSLISIMLGPPGMNKGRSLAEQISYLERLCVSDPRILKNFRDALRSAGYKIEDSLHYSRKYVKRRFMGLIFINDSFPAITRPMIQSAFGADSWRVESLQFDVNVEGLEYEETSSEFSSTIF